MVSFLLQQLLDFFPRALKHVTFSAQEPSPPGLVVPHLVFLGFFAVCFLKFSKKKVHGFAVGH